MKYHRVPAVSVAVIKAGKLEWTAAWGTLGADDTKTADANTMFQAASISKPVTALAALHMAQNGNFALDDDVNTTLKTWKVPAFNFPGKVTLRELLSHSAGLTVHGFGGYAAGEPVPTVPQILDGVPLSNSKPIRVDVAPGTVWRYSGGGYTVIQQLLIDKSGMSFPDLMDRMVLKRIGMTHSAYSQPLAALYQGNAARAHLNNGTMIKGRWHTYPEMAAAGLWTTPSDLAKFLIEVRSASRGESNKVIDRAMAQEMLKIQMGSYGLGLGIEGEGAERWFGHGGSNEGFKCDMRMYLESGDGVVVMTNGDSGSALAREIERAVADAYGLPGLKPEVKKVVTVSPADLARLAGEYSLEGLKLRVSVKGGGITVLSSIQAEPAEFLPQSETEFFPTVDGLGNITFAIGPDGKVNEFSLFGSTAKRASGR